MAIKLRKNELGKPVKVTWYDNRSAFRINLRKFIRESWGEVITYGTLAYYNRSEDMIIVSTEQGGEGDSDNDYTMIFWSKIKEIEFL